ncbi:hypothetical protein IAD21_00620 [Abditibacteriota bacterium]|nr:hypothetical protein IAD21_00620 [Abditibacteriota bacterium]
MLATPSFLDQFIKEQATRQPDETTPTSGELHLRSTWGFEAPSNDKTKGWQIGNTLQLFEGTPKSTSRIWEITTAFLCPGDSPRMEKAGRLVPAFAGDELEGSMRSLGFGPGQWREGPSLTFSRSLSPDEFDGPMLESFQQLGFAVER